MMRWARESILAVLAIGLLVLAPPTAAKDVPAPKADAWDSTEGPPAWIDAAAPSAAVVRGVVAAQSDGLALAMPPGGVSPQWLSRSISSSIAWRLRPVLGEGADALLDLVLPTPPATRRAYHLTPARREDHYPGAQTYTVWILWEIPATAIVERISADRRDEAVKALSTAEPKGTPAWEEVPTAPAWAAATPATANTWTVTVVESADRADVARAQSAALSEERVAWSMAEPLRALLGPEVSWDTGRRAATWRRLTSRASSTTGERPSAWARFEVPMARILAAVPEAHRDAARKILVPSPAK